MNVPVSAAKTAFLAAGLASLAGLCKAQTIGLSYGQSSALGGLLPNRTAAVGVFAELPLGKRFAVSSGLGYLWYTAQESVYWGPGCFGTNDDSFSPVVHWRQDIRMAEVPLDASYRLLGKRGSRAQLRLTAGLSYVAVLRAGTAYTHENGSTESSNERGREQYASLFPVKLGLEEKVRLGPLSLAIGAQLRHTTLLTQAPEQFGAAALYLKAGWQVRQHAPKQ